MSDRTQVAPHAPPNNVQAECALLGSLLLALGDLDQVFEQLEAEHFYLRKHQIIFESVHKVREEHGTVDTMLLQDYLERNEQLAAVGGVDYLFELSESVTTSASAEYYLKAIRDTALLRRLMSTCSEIIEESLKTGTDGARQLELAQEKIYELGQREGTREIITLSEAIKGTFDMIDAWAKGGTGLASGYTDLDRLTSGLQPSELIVVAGRPSMGKTTISLNIAQYIAITGSRAVAIFSLEVESRQIAMNLLCGEARVESQKLRGNDLGSRDWERLMAAAGRLSEATIFIDDSANLTVMSIRAKARRLKKQYDIDLIVIDYLQLLEHGGRRSESRQQEISDISRSLKAMARELRIPVLTISQLSRGVEQRDNKRPRMSDLRESGAIEQDADLILLIYRDEYYYPDKQESKGKAEVIVAKNRNGPVGKAELAFIGEYMRFENLAHDFQSDF